MTMKKLKKTELPHLTLDLIGNYHYGLNIEHAKPVLEKGLIVSSLFWRHTTATKQAAGWGWILQASLYRKSLNKSTVKMEVYI